ncbi:hypothetical protein [Methylobacterium oryzae]|uniref:hypothetical protein n=1 Tax=Methylobacterium oryzae TaxID=334852 RepID=UPI002F35758D
MALSECEIATRLAALRRQREALDREIADLVLYQELGRRLAAGGSDPRPDPVPDPDPPVVIRGDPASDPAPRQHSVPEVRSGPVVDAKGAPRGRLAAEAGPAVRSAMSPDPAGGAGPIPPAIAFTEDAAGARRYGRAVVQAASRADKVRPRRADLDVSNFPDARQPVTATCSGIRIFTAAWRAASVHTVERMHCTWHG